VEFAARLLASVRETDLVARLGGDEFVVLLEGMNGRLEATLVAEKIRAQLQAPMSAHGAQVFVTSSIGIALVDESDCTPATITAKADAALYCAKRSGRDRYAIAGGDASKENAGLALTLQA
jgi:diguanylate cyclase (GGDEF)-like protein